jgi:hypothetical protein
MRRSLTIFAGLNFLTISQSVDLIVTFAALVARASRVV